MQMTAQTSLFDAPQEDAPVGAPSAPPDGPSAPETVTSEDFPTSTAYTSPAPPEPRHDSPELIALWLELQTAGQALHRADRAHYPTPHQAQAAADHANAVARRAKAAYWTARRQARA